MVQQSTNNIFENVYKFNGKELDEQTGYYYYGARYYDPGASIFLSVDPLAEKYPEYNPYTYTLNNPIRFVDPDGRAPQDHIFYFRGGSLVNMVDTKKGNSLIFNINGRNQSLNPSNSSNSSFFKQVSQFYAKEQNFKGNVNYKIEPSGSSVGGFYSPTNKSITMTDVTYLNSSNVNDIRSTMGHEVDHSKNPVSTFMDHANTYMNQDLNGTSDEYKINNSNQFMNRVLNAYDNNEIDTDGISNAMNNYNNKNEDVKVQGLNFMGTVKGAKFKTYINGNNRSNGYKYEKLDNPSK